MKQTHVFLIFCLLLTACGSVGSSNEPTVVETAPPSCVDGDVEIIGTAYQAVCQNGVRVTVTQNPAGTVIVPTEVPTPEGWELPEGSPTEFQGLQLPSRATTKEEWLGMTLFFFGNAGTAAMSSESVFLVTTVEGLKFFGPKAVTTTVVGAAAVPMMVLGTAYIVANGIAQHALIMQVLRTPITAPVAIPAPEAPLTIAQTATVAVGESLAAIQNAEIKQVQWKGTAITVLISHLAAPCFTNISFFVYWYDEDGKQHKKEFEEDGCLKTPRDLFNMIKSLYYKLMEWGDQFSPLVFMRWIAPAIEDLGLLLFAALKEVIKAGG